MDYFNYKQGQLYAEDVSVKGIANTYGTPCYIYSRATLERHWHAFNNAFGDHNHLICYSVKACSNLAILNLFARLGSGFDIVSVGELERVIAAGGDPEKWFSLASVSVMMKCVARWKSVFAALTSNLRRN